MAFYTGDDSSDGAQQVPGAFRAVSSLAQSVERRDTEELALVEAICSLSFVLSDP